MRVFCVVCVGVSRPRVAGGEVGVVGESCRRHEATGRGVVGVVSGRQRRRGRGGVRVWELGGGKTELDKI